MTELITLRVKVLEKSADKDIYAYDLGSAAQGAGPIEQEYSVDVSSGLVRQLVDRMDAVLTAPAGADRHQQLVRYGQALFDALLTRVDNHLPQLVGRLTQDRTPLLVRTNEMLVPWELLHDGTEFLALGRDLGRKSMVERRLAPGRLIGPIRRVLIVADPLGDLPAARAEAATIAALFTERGSECTVLSGAEAGTVELLMALRAEHPPDLLHYCGHVVGGERGVSSALVMHNREVFDDNVLQTVHDVGAPPVVFINGCASAGQVSSLCTSFMVTGAKTVVGTRHEVDEAPARDFALGFYRELLAGATTGQAVRTTRRAMHDARTSGWASYVLYGDPTVHIDVGRIDHPARPAAEAVTAGRPAGPQPAELTSAAAELMRAARRSASAAGPVSSLDLLYALLTAPGTRPGIVARIGTERLELLIALLDRVLDQPSEIADRTEVELSDTVERILTEAAARMAGDDRAGITVEDIAAGFVAVGGGSAAELLRACGMPLSILLTAAPVGAAAPAEAFVAGRLASSAFDREAGAAIRMAAMLARSRSMVVSTEMMLLGLWSHSGVLRDCVAEQGDAAVAELDRLLASLVKQRTTDFSARTVAVLDDAVNAGAGPATDSDLLRALLTVSGSAARERLARLGVDVEKLLTAVADRGLLHGLSGPGKP